MTTVDIPQPSENLSWYDQWPGPPPSSINHLHRYVDLQSGLRDGCAVVCVASILDRSTKVDQGSSFIQWNSGDVFNEVDPSVCLVALLCNTEEETEW